MVHATQDRLRNYLSVGWQRRLVGWEWHREGIVNLLKIAPRHLSLEEM